MASNSENLWRFSSKAAYGALSLLAVVVFITIWAILTRLRVVEPLFLPSPGSVLLAIRELVTNGQLPWALAVTLGRILRALLLTVAVGVPLGVLVGGIHSLDSIFQPFLQPMRYLPITALLPLFILWFGIGDTMKVAFLFMGTVVYLIPLTRNAVHNTKEDYLEIGRDMGFSRWETILKIRLPAAWPEVWRGIVVCSAISWTYVILAEIIDPETGLGYLISIAGRLQRSDQVFAGLVFIGTVAICSDRILNGIGRRYFNW